MATTAEMAEQRRRVVEMAKDLGRRDAEVYMERGAAWPCEDTLEYGVTIENDPGFREVWGEIDRAIAPSGDDTIKSRLYTRAWHAYRDAYLT